MDSIPHAFDAGDKGSGIVAANIIVIILATVAVGLRIVSRRMQRLALEMDDYLIFVAVVSCGPIRKSLYSKLSGIGALTVIPSLLDGRCVYVL